MTAPQTSLRQVHIDKVQALFSEAPSLNDVATDSAQAYLDLHFAGRNYLAARLYVVAPTGPYRSLADKVLERLAAASPTLLVAQYHQVMQRVREIYVPGGPSLDDIELLINHCGTELLRLYAQRLQAWWREAVPVNMTRWGYLSDELLELLYDATPPAGMTQARFDAVFPRSTLHARRPNRMWSAHSLALKVQTVHVRQPAQMLPLLLFSQPNVAGLWLFDPATGVQALDNLDALQVLLPGYTHLTQWFTADAQGDPFDALAASYLQRQLLDIASLNPKVPRPLAEYQQLLGMITDSHRWFVPPVSERQQYWLDKLPLWLAHADADACIAYAQLLQALVLDRRQHGTANFLEDIPTLQGYANEHLQTCLRKLPKAATLTPEDVSLTFEQVIAAAVPVPGGFTAGEVHRIDVSLTELALENLAGFPYTVKAIHPAWLSYESLKACVTQVDVGQAYPALLKKHLIDDSTEVARRGLRFSQQLRIQLPMQALEWQLKGEHGLSREGFRRLRAALQATAAERKVAGQGMALWPLAFKATATSTADTVTNMFIIGPQQGEAGCHLLYRPLFEPPLLEFATLDALFEAIKLPGAVQESVLTWIPSRRQAVYANGGFREPHVRHFLVGDEFTRFEKPAPAQLSKTVAEADPAQQLFAATAQALVTLADRQSVSNAEQRWAGLKQLGWLLFGTLQPLLSGPLMLAGWLVQLLDSAEQDIIALQGTDQQARNAALLDMLVNLMVIVAHQAAPHDVQRHLELEHPVFAPKVEPPAVLPTKIAAPAQFIAPASWANSRNTLTPQLQARLQALSLKSFPKPWPQALPGAEPSGPRQGLLRVQQQWQALVRGQQFRVRMEQDRVRVVSADGQRLGPWLKSVGRGQWDVDLQLRLSGGADTGGDAPLDWRQVENQYRQAITERGRAFNTMELARTLAEKAQGEGNEPQQARLLSSYYKATETMARKALTEWHYLRQLRSLKPLPRYETTECDALESIINALTLLDIQLNKRAKQTGARMLPLLERAEHDRDMQAHTELNQLTRELVAIYDSQIDWRTQEDRCLDALRKVPRLGRDRANALIEETQLLMDRAQRSQAKPIPARPSLLALKSQQVRMLWTLATDVPAGQVEDEVASAISHTFTRTRWACSSFVERSQVLASNTEQIELLDSLDNVFAQTDDQIEFWRAVEPDRFSLPDLEKLQQLLAGLHRQVEDDLQALLQPAPGAEPAPKVSAPPAPGRRKKIIRTRNRDLFVVQTETADTTTAQVNDDTGAVIGTFTVADDGVWEPAPAPSRPDPELGALVKTANTLLQDVDKAIASVEALAKRTHSPASLQDLLDAEARRRLWTANKIREKLNDDSRIRLAAPQQDKARTAEAALRTAVARLEAKGLAVRISATRNKVLNQDDVAFLHAQNQVRIVRKGPRVALIGRKNDFLQEYAVNDARTGKAMAYAHFHYTSSRDVDDNFSAAHLKTPDQARLGRMAQARVETQAFERMRSGQGGRAVQPLEIHRSEIQRRLALRLFIHGG
ncbi:MULTISPECIES: hypothetical protein [Pseudomonas]|uniref:Uncharacterized protein n=1 Tax=Pseudomonas fluorescens LMG 5329 TaxID=1324332 RepID=A0A0A1YZY4_PSEFL|nr:MULTISPECIES: hypothetical protein [Pseudomonas]KGE67503.1 hypothetical protein K814_0113070 [Pseudomonas fluorescens LMG 5329]NWD99459.1 hypothetical protein [Pseudomonas sp. IPO3749]NWF18858.1 hypothetical protein [Pseudomonas sp. IPO3749]